MSGRPYERRGRRLRLLRRRLRRAERLNELGVHGAQLGVLSLGQVHHLGGGGGARLLGGGGGRGRALRAGQLRAQLLVQRLQLGVFLLSNEVGGGWM